MDTSDKSQGLDQLQRRLAHRFRDPALLECALTHRSFLQDHPDTQDSNQRLEFLGDTVLQMVLTEALFRCFPEEREGLLTRRRSVLTRGTHLASLAATLGVPALLRMATSEEAGGGRTRTAALEDAFEALVGALYLDSDLDTTRRVLLGLFGDLALASASVALSTQEHGEAANPYAIHDNPKGLLQERVHPVFGNQALRYELVATTGEDHNRSYEMAVFLHETRLGSGTGSSKKAAETAAARMALHIIDRDGLPTT